MSKTPEQILKEMIGEQAFQIAQLVAQIDKQNEELRVYKAKFAEVKPDGSKQDV